MGGLHGRWGSRAAPPCRRPATAAIATAAVTFASERSQRAPAAATAALPAVGPSHRPAVAARGATCGACSRRDPVVPRPPRLPRVCITHRRRRCERRGRQWGRRRPGVGGALYDTVDRHVTACIASAGADTVVARLPPSWEWSDDAASRDGRRRRPWHTPLRACARNRLGRTASGWGGRPPAGGGVFADTPTRGGVPVFAICQPAVCVHAGGRGGGVAAGRSAAADDDRRGRAGAAGRRGQSIIISVVVMMASG